MALPFRTTLIVAPIAVSLSCWLAAADEPIFPVIEGPWWTVASHPQLPGAYHSDAQEPVDFGLWQAADGTWQLWSCIRKTKTEGHTRLFYGWEGASLHDRDWPPRGIVMESDAAYGEPPGGLQAPHVVKLGDRYLMAYGNWEAICFAESADGKTFTRIVRPDGHTAVFGEGPRANARDAMLIDISGLWHCYYTAILDDKGYGLCRTSPDLRTWSESFVVNYGGRVGPGKWTNECPHVVEIAPGEFVYFRNEYYGERQMNWQYYSRNPRNFGIDSDAGLVSQLPVAAPEIVLHDGQYYIASLKPSLDGIQMARLAFYRRGGLGKPVFDFDTEDGRAGWRVTSGKLDMLFCDKPHQDFEGPMTFGIGTSEKRDGSFDDAMTGAIESPEFTLKEEHYYVLVSGGDRPERVYVAIVDAESGDELARWSGHFSNTLKRHAFSTLGHAGKQVRIRIVDEARGGWGHINFGGIFAEGERKRVPVYAP